MADTIGARPVDWPTAESLRVAAALRSPPAILARHCLSAFAQALGRRDALASPGRHEPGGVVQRQASFTPDSTSVEP